MKLLFFILVAFMDVLPGGKAYLKPLQQRDSILVADQFEYGVQLDTVDSKAMLALPDFSEVSNDTLTLVRNWKVDTLFAGRPVTGKQLSRLQKKGKPLGIRASIIVAPFEEGHYTLPDIPMQRTAGSIVDTLVFEGTEIDVKTMPVDTATFVIHDLKGLVKYPVTFREVAPWVGAVWLIAILLILAVALARSRKAEDEGVDSHKDPAYIVALRQLEKYRGDRYWAPEKQKMFYSGITDALKAYIEDRFGVDAPEMTTAELFAALKGNKDLTPELYNEAKELFECADFVKFAKHTVSDADNAKAVPFAVRFVTSTYQIEPEEGTSDNDGGEAVKK